MATPAFQSRIPFEASRIQAAAIYCSDGRFGEHMDDFLHNALELPRYDRLIIPGGAACLGGHLASFREEEALVEQLRFLVSVHQLRRVVLVAHKDCAYYTAWLRVSSPRLEEQQNKDLARAVERIRALSRGLQVDAYFACAHGEGVAFEEVRIP